MTPLAEVYTLVNLWHVVGGAALVVFLQYVAFVIGDSHGYHRAPSDLRRRAERAEIEVELTREREKSTVKGLTTRLTTLEGDYAKLKGAAVNLAWAAQSTPTHDGGVRG